MSTKAGKKGPGQPRASPKMDFDNIEELQRHYDEKFKILEASVQAKVDTLHRILETKDEVIGKLHKEIGELKKGFDFMSTETAEIRKCVKDKTADLNQKIDSAENKIHSVKEKTVDLEDRSRRCNLIFFNFKEAGPNSSENCEDMVESCLKSLNIFGHEDIWIDRAHRLGKRRQEHNIKPRPIIVKFAYYKQKEKIINSGKKFRDCPINVSEDFSKETLQIHSQLYKHGKEAKESKYVDDTKAIKYFKVTYRRLIVTYTTNKHHNDAVTFVRSFSLKDIQENPNWYIPPQQQNQRQNV